MTFFSWISPFTKRSGISSPAHLARLWLTWLGVVDVKDLFFISSNNSVQPVESAASGERLSADVQASLAVAVAQCMWEPLIKLFTIPRLQSIAHVESEQPKLAARHRTPSYGCCSARFFNFSNDIALGRPERSSSLSFLFPALKR
ncbi:hypothetical protein RB195_023029 [Necator americanus]|uniref:Uncharacterized protein n=1 Tax=Necator americanus TaxID=51031 RepID=A0ABR1EHI5_NECAM